MRLVIIDRGVRLINLNDYKYIHAQRLQVNHFGFLDARLPVRAFVMLIVVLMLIPTLEFHFD